MIPTEAQIISQMENLIKFDTSKTSSEDLITWANNILNLFKLFLPPKCSQIQTLENSLNEFLTGGLYYGNRQEKLFIIFKGILRAVSSDYKKGFVKDLRTEIRAEVETDFLSQAGRLLEEKLKDPAAMLIGAVLEDTLRQLCKKHGVPEGANIESMNAPLKKAGVYGLPVQQQVTAWAAIRNKADHARFDGYDLQQVKLMHQGVGGFIAKFIS